MDDKKIFDVAFGDNTFLIARNELSEELEEILVDYVIDKMMGRQLLTPDSTMKELHEMFDKYFVQKEEQERVLEMLKQGKSIYMVHIIDDNYYEDRQTNLYIGLWEKLVEVESDSIKLIDSAMIK